MRYIEYLVNKKYGSIMKFADALEIPKCTMYHYFSKMRFPNVHNFMEIAFALDMTAEDLYRDWYKEIDTDD